jgi:hypothetical protein
MQTFLATLLFIAMIMTFMAVGVIFSSRRLRGSCGGTGSDCACDDEAQRSCPHRPGESESSGAPNPS